MYTCKFTLVFSYQNNEPQKSGDQPANLNPHKIVAGIRAVAPPIQMGFSLDEHSSNHPVILEQLWCPICLMIEPTTGAWSCHVGHWYVLTVPSSGSWHRSNSDYRTAGGRHETVCREDGKD